MPIDECRLKELERAYQVLGVPLSASALSITKTYHRVAKRWHPDVYPSGTPAHAEATRMMKLINEAYSTIEHAPLRYHVETYPAAGQGRRPPGRPPKSEPATADRITLPVTDRLEFWVRFVCGALLGALMSFSLVLNFFEHPNVLIFGTVSLVPLCGFAAARYGDRFWHTVLKYWWLWS
jgi:hypothetical protein